jgi:hypothetical protein
MKEKTMAQDHVSYVDHIPVISVGHEGAPLALWIPPLGMTKDDMRPLLESLAGVGFRAVSLDPWQHGERGSESADEIRARVHRLPASYVADHRSTRNPGNWPRRNWKSTTP